LDLDVRAAPPDERSETGHKTTRPPDAQFEKLKLGINSNVRLGI
jgi:hypothetical protein